MNWPIQKLSDCCISITDGDHQAPPKTSFGIPFVTISNITSTNNLNFDGTLYVTKDYYDKLDDKRKARKGDVLYSVVGSFGLPVYIKNDKPFAFQRHIAILRTNEKLLSKFLYYTMLTKDFYMMADSVAIGAAQRTVTLTALRNMKIKVPNIKTQAKIISVLSSYDDLIENNQKQIKLLEEAAQRLYKEWFVDFRFPGHENTTFVDGLPEGWEYLPIKDAFSWIRGKSYTSLELSDTEGVKLVNLKNIKAFGGYNRGAEKRFTGSFKQEQLLQPGDVVMGVTDMTKERRLVGHVAIIPDLKEKMTFSMDLIKLLPNRISKCYLYSLMFFGGYSKKISPLANGTNVLHLKPEAMNTMSILIPNKVIMTQYDDLFTYYNRKIEMLEDQIEVLKEARDRLLPKLMNGEIEV